MAMLDVVRFSGFMGHDPEDDAVWFAVEMAESLIYAYGGALVTDPPQPGLAPVAFSVAARLLSGPPGVASESEGGVSISYRPDAGTVELTPSEQLAVQRALGRHGGLGSVELRADGYRRRRFDPGR